MTNIKDFLVENSFDKHIDVTHRHSISDAIKDADSCGIYILDFADGTYYVGQAVDVRRRFLQHKKNFDDIVAVHFRHVNKQDLDTVERDMIAKLEVIAKVRNIRYASMPDISNSDLDELISRETQDAWLANNDTPITFIRKRVVDDDLRQKYESKYRKVTENREFIKYCIPVLKKYVSKCIIEPYLTELTYWGSSAVNSCRNKCIVFTRINVRFQEVFTLGYHYLKKIPVYSWHVALSPFMDKETDQYNFEPIPKTIYLGEDFYPSGGEDQFLVEAYSLDDALDLLDNPVFLTAAKSFNLACLRKGAQPYAKYHCSQIADLILP